MHTTKALYAIKPFILADIGEGKVSILNTKAGKTPVNRKLDRNHRVPNHELVREAWRQS